MRVVCKTCGQEVGYYFTKRPKICRMIDHVKQDGTRCPMSKAGVREYATVTDAWTSPSEEKLPK